MDNLSGQRKKGVVLSYVYSVAQVSVYLVYVPLLLSGIGQEEYGLYQLVGSAAAYIVSISNVLSYGVGRYYCMYYAEDDICQMENTLAISKRLYWIMSGVGIILFAIMAVLVQYVYADSFKQSQLNECSGMLIVLAFNTMVTMHNTINIAVITARERFSFLNISKLISLIAQPIVVIVAIRYFPNALTVTCVVFLMNVICAGAQRVYAQSVLKASYTYHGWDKDLAIGLVKFSGAILLVTIADQIFWNANQLIVGYFYGATAVAVYAIGAQVYRAYMPLGYAISSVFLPKISHLYFKEKDMVAINALLIKVGRLAAYVLLAVLLGFCVFGRDFIHLWAGAEYDQAYWIALVVMIPFTVDLVQNLWLTVMQVMDRYWFRGYMYLVVALMNAVAVAVLVVPFGLVGAATASGVSMLIGNGLVMNIYYKKKMCLDVIGYWKNMIRLALPAVCLMVIAGLVWLCASSLFEMSWALLLVGVATFGVFYIVTMHHFAMNEYEKHLVGMLVGKVIMRR